MWKLMVYCIGNCPRLHSRLLKWSLLKLHPFNFAIHEQKEHYAGLPVSSTFTNCDFFSLNKLLLSHSTLQRTCAELPGRRIDMHRIARSFQTANKERKLEPSPRCHWHRPSKEQILFCSFCSVFTTKQCTFTYIAVSFKIILSKKQVTTQVWSYPELWQARAKFIHRAPKVQLIASRLDWHGNDFYVTRWNRCHLLKTRVICIQMNIKIINKPVLSWSRTHFVANINNTIYLDHRSLKFDFLFAIAINAWHHNTVQSVQMSSPWKETKWFLMLCYLFWLISLQM